MAIGNFNPEEPSAASQSARAMRAAINAFLETNFASYLHLGELDLAGLRQFCFDPSAKKRPPMVYSGKPGPSFTSHGN